MFKTLEQRRNSILFVCLQWKEVKPEELMDSKLRCVFEFPDDKKAQSATEGEYRIISMVISLIVMPKNHSNRI